VREFTSQPQAVWPRPGESWGSGVPVGIAYPVHDCGHSGRIVGYTELMGVAPLEVDYFRMARHTPGIGSASFAQLTHTERMFYMGLQQITDNPSIQIAEGRVEKQLENMQLENIRACERA